MIKNLKKKLYISVFTVLAWFYISGCGATLVPETIPMEQVQQIETEKTTKKDIFNKFGSPKAIAAKDEVSTFPAERIKVGIPFYEKITALPYYKIDSDTLFELFSKDRQLTEYHQIYYYSDLVPRWYKRGLFQPQSRLWILINEKTNIVEDYIFRMHYNVWQKDVLRDVKPFFSEP